MQNTHEDEAIWPNEKQTHGNRFRDHFRLVRRKHVLISNLVAQVFNNARATVTTLIFTPGYARIRRTIDGFSIQLFGNWQVEVGGFLFGFKDGWGGLSE